MPETEHNWAQICSEIVVAAYGTRIVGEWDGVGEYPPWGTAPAAQIADWPLCVYPLEECEKGVRAGDGTTLHTYYYAPVPKYHEGEVPWLCNELQRKGWLFGERYQPAHRPPLVEYDDGHMLAWVNKPPLTDRRLRKDSITATAGTSFEAMTLAIHKALMEGAE